MSDVKRACGKYVHYKPRPGEDVYHYCNLPVRHPGPHRVEGTDMSWFDASEEPDPVKITESTNLFERIQAERDAIRFELMEEVFAEMYDLKKKTESLPLGELLSKEEKETSLEVLDDVLDLLDQRMQRLLTRWGL